MILKRDNAKIEPVKRIAIIIANNKWGGNFLGGVELDCIAMKKFLLSPFGGSWEDNEIITLANPISAENLISEIQEKINDGKEYFYLYFSGHGELKKPGDPLFVLPGGEELKLSEIRETLKGFPALMIADSCQGIPSYKEGGSILEQRSFASDSDKGKNKSRLLFDDVLRKLPPIFTFASAVSPGQYALDDDIKGGLYTQHLLSSCYTIKNNPENERGVYGICYPHTLARLRVVKETAGTQIPSISGYNRTFQPPFLVKL